MTLAVTKILIGLFIWIALPSLLKKSIKNKALFKFVSISCLIIGVIVLIYGAIGLLENVLSLND
jgi:hypothetical protein